MFGINDKVFIKDKTRKELESILKKAGVYSNKILARKIIKLKKRELTIIAIEPQKNIVKIKPSWLNVPTTVIRPDNFQGLFNDLAKEAKDV